MQCAESQTLAYGSRARQTRAGPLRSRARAVHILARGAVSIGLAAVFMETHQAPDTAPSDGPNMIPLSEIKGVIETLMEFDRLAKARPVSV